jgi:serine/threonine protein kinase
MTNRMLYQILDALDHVHTQGIIHRDIKPENILYDGVNDEFLLTDFGIAKFVDTSRTITGTPWYMAPEVRQNGEQTPKVDIYGLGATVVECLEKLPSEADRRATWQHWLQWHQYLQTLANQHEPRVAPMLADVADQRPTARDLLDDFFPQPAHTLHGPRNGITPSSLGVSSHLTNQVNGTTTIYSTAASAMDWTRGATAIFQGNPQPTQRDGTQPSKPNPVAAQSPKVPPNRQPGGIRRKGSVKSAKSVDERQKKGRKRGGSSQNTPSQSAGVLKRTSSSRRWRSRSKSVQKAQEVRVLGMA